MGMGNRRLITEEVNLRIELGFLKGIFCVFVTRTPTMVAHLPGLLTSHYGGAKSGPGLGKSIKVPIDKNRK